MGKFAKISICIVALLIIVDASFLIKFLILNTHLIWKTSLCRLIVFTLQHFYFAAMLILLWKLDYPMTEDAKIYRLSYWFILSFLPIAVIDTFIQIGLYIVFGAGRNETDTNFMKQNPNPELSLINFYFMTYMYFMMIGILSALYIGVNLYLEKRQKSKYLDAIQQILDNYLLQLEKADPIFKQFECSICQIDSSEQADPSVGVKIEIIRLSCDHMFHKECILQWVKKTYQQSMSPRCPNCRKQINQ